MRAPHQYTPDFSHEPLVSVNAMLGDRALPEGMHRALAAFRMLAPQGKVLVSLNASLGRGVFGMCAVPRDPKTERPFACSTPGARATIFLSVNNCTCKDAGDGRYNETLCHELAHAATWVNYPEEFDTAHHGEVWAEFMGAIHAALLAARLAEGDPEARILLNRGVEHGKRLDPAPGPLPLRPATQRPREMVRALAVAQFARAFGMASPAQLAQESGGLVWDPAGYIARAAASRDTSSEGIDADVVRILAAQRMLIMDGKGEE